MFLELRRVFSGMGGRGWPRLAFDFLVLPFLVAAIMTTAFLARSTPDAHRDSFLYFGTLYAFWCGLFGSCQAFNGEVASGEWSYWMLGMRRGICRHYLAHFAVSVLFGLTQVAVSLFFLWGIWKLGAVIKPLGYFFISPDKGNSFVNQMAALLKGGTAYNLQKLQSTMKHFDSIGGGQNITWFIFCAKFYLLGSVTAIVSGVTLGLLISSLCQTPQVSLTVSVLIVVSCTIFSYVGIKGGTNDQQMAREFAPVTLICRQGGRQFMDALDLEGRSPRDDRFPKYQSRWRDGGTVEMTSFVLPQRFFYNIARIPCLDLEYSLGSGIDAEWADWYDPKRLLEHASNTVIGCKCPVCIGLVSMQMTNQVPMVIETTGEMNSLDHHWIEKSGSTWKDAMFSDREWECPGAFQIAMRENRGGIKSLLSLSSMMAWTEAAVAMLWCVAHFLATLFCIHKKEMFRELR